MNKIDILAGDLDNIVSTSKDYLKTYVLEKNGIKLRQFYGATYTLALFHGAEDYYALRKILLKQYSGMDKSNPEFHWEFNNYALQEISIANASAGIDDVEVDELLLPLQFKGTPCTNWTLLRCLVKLRNGDMSPIIACKEKLHAMQGVNGLIMDDKGVKSFQYHCFSTALVYEIYESTKDAYFLNVFKNAVVFIRNFILPSGETLIIGRGQNQSFGYGSLVFVLCKYLQYLSLIHI